MTVGSPWRVVGLESSSCTRCSGASSLSGESVGQRSEVCLYSKLSLKVGRQSVRFSLPNMLSCFRVFGAGLLSEERTPGTCQSARILKPSLCFQTASARVLTFDLPVLIPTQQ